MIKIKISVIFNDRNIIIKYMRYKKNVRRASKARRASKKRLPMRKTIGKIVRREISRAAEDKHVRNSSGSVLFTDPSTSNFRQGNIWDLSAPVNAITTGTGPGGRIGNKIKLKRFVLKFLMWPKAGFTRLCLVKMWIISDRFNPNNSTPFNIQDAVQSTGVFFENGNTTSGFVSSLTDMLFPVNSDRFKVHKTKTFKVGYASGPTSGSGNNDFKVMHRVSVNVLKYMPKNFKYQDGESTTTYQRRVFVLFQVVPSDNTQFLPTDDPVYIQRTYDVKYEDL